MTGVGRKGMHDQSGKEGHALPEWKAWECLAEESLTEEKQCQ